MELRTGLTTVMPTTPTRPAIPACWSAVSQVMSEVEPSCVSGRGRCGAAGQARAHCDAAMKSAADGTGSGPLIVIFSVDRLSARLVEEGVVGEVVAFVP